jgi:hypothetical protein
MAIRAKILYQAIDDIDKVLYADKSGLLGRSLTMKSVYLKVG